MYRTKAYLLLLVVGVMGLCAFAQTNSLSKAQERERLAQTALPSWTWAQESWTGDDAAYVKIRISIDAEVEHTPKQTSASWSKNMKQLPINSPKIPRLNLPGAMPQSVHAKPAMISRIGNGERP